ncbi:hypothetical protein E5676_scaffold2047G00160 [Cucumis melo var. makuwa]|uniref:Uncharacterized protein n=1 Tax=Cucumis melo var. makuwa TaxID=1194695 RepID=A0A5D3CTM7_CUCMM|nr:hypothetical protein E6C27_scaffold84G001960 [Cucumis melo var. makuwa]TYK14885.1 hypothetical protein E5676_scaffold2047G00160 [Cucumis melo var. makuwa]
MWVGTLSVRPPLMTDSSTRRSQFKIDGSRHFVLPPLVDLPCVENNPKVHRFVKEWKQMADIAQACPEKLQGRWRKGRIKSDVLLSFERIIKFPINGATMPYDYLSTKNRKKIEKPKKSLLTE